MKPFCTAFSYLLSFSLSKILPIRLSLRVRDRFHMHRRSEGCGLGAKRVNALNSKARLN
jgi:hypothetical protein